MRTGIRGFIASASLKLGTARLSIGALRRIRGFIASASLKLVSYLLYRIMEMMYPRLYCLGLIEAHAHNVAGGVIDQVSEALLPRPH